MKGKFSYLVLGTGVGKAIAARLLKREDTTRVTLADNDYHRAEETVRTLAPKQFRTERLMPTFFSVEHTSDADIQKMFAPFQVVISAIPAKHNVRLMDLAISAKTNWCDLGGINDVTRQQLQLDKRAKKAGISCVVDEGISPGTGNKLAQLTWLSWGTRNITIYVGGLPQNAQPPHNYQRTFSLEGLMHILDPSPILRSGKIVTAPPCSEVETVQIPSLEKFSTHFGGNVEAFVTAGAGLAAEWFKKKGVENFCEKTLRWPGFLQYVGGIPREKLLGRFGEDLPPTDSVHPDLLIMRVVGTQGHRGETVIWELLDTFDPVTGLSAMQRTTGFSAAATAYGAAHGQVRVGVHAPEKAYEPSQLRAHLELLGKDLNLTHTVIEK